jgi:hypothetical protein
MKREDEILVGCNQLSNPHFLKTSNLEREGI